MSITIHQFLFVTLFITSTIMPNHDNLEIYFTVMEILNISDKIICTSPRRVQNAKKVEGLKTLGRMQYCSIFSCAQSSNLT